MKHAGKATKAAFKLIYWTLFGLLALALAGTLARILGHMLVEIVGGLLGLWVLFTFFCFFFFRDPEPVVPAESDAIISPAFGTVDLIDETDEPLVMGGRCRRISIFLSVMDVHVQRSPVAGKITLCRHTPGQFLNAMRADCAAFNENVLMGIESSERPGERIGVRVIAGLIARRIVPWVTEGETYRRGERISLVQFGSRCNLYLPLDTQITLKLGDKVRGGETVVAKRIRA